MKSFLSSYPVLARFILSVVMFGLALLIGTVIDGPLWKRYFPYLSFLLLLLVTWLLYKWDGQHLGALGLQITRRHMMFLFFGVLIGAASFMLANLARSFYTGESITLSKEIDFRTVFGAFYFILPTVAVEELLFRGYLFKKTISVTNAVVANVIFAMLFMLIHVVDESVLRSPGRLVMLVISIPVGHLFFATALLRSNTLYFPIGLHLGNNWATRHLISGADDGNSILVVLGRTNFDDWPSFIGLLMIYNGVFVLVTYCIWKWSPGKRGLLKGR